MHPESVHKLERENEGVVEAVVDKEVSEPIDESSRILVVEDTVEQVCSDDIICISDDEEDDVEAVEGVIEMKLRGSVEVVEDRNNSVVEEVEGRKITRFQEKWRGRKIIWF